MDSVQMGMQVGIAKETMEFQANMTANLINGSLGVQAQDQSMNLARNLGLAAEGIGSKLNIVA